MRKLPGYLGRHRVRERGDWHAGSPAAHRRLAHRPRTCHGGAANGDLLCCWFAGTYEAAQMCTSSAQCCRMTEPSGWSRWISPATPPAASRTPRCSYGPDNAVWAMYTAPAGPCRGQGQHAVHRCGALPKEHRRRQNMGRLHHRVPGGRHLLPSAHSGAVQRPLDLCQLAVHRLCRGSFRRPHRLPHLGRRGQNLAHGHDARQQRPCPCQCH